MYCFLQLTMFCLTAEERCTVYEVMLFLPLLVTCKMECEPNKHSYEENCAAVYKLILLQ